MYTARKIIFLVALTTLLLGLSATMVAAATPPQPTYGAAVIDGVTGEWSLTNDFFAEMHRAFNPKQKLESKLYLRYDCSKKVLNALVLAEPGVGVLQQPGDAWIKLAGSAGNLVDGNSGNNGVAPDFSWVYVGGALRGYEASAPLAEGNYKFTAHIEVSDGGAQTSGTDRKTDPNGIPLEIKCPVGVPSITIKKYTNGEDADAAPGPYIFAGFPVNWTYKVTNSGTAPLSNVTVTDSKGVSVNCSSKTTLAVGETMTCTASGSADPGQYENIGTATGVYNGTTVTSSDPSHYFGATPAIRITKFTNGEDANTETGPFIPVGGAVTWRYDVTNAGNVPLSNVAVTDSKGVSVSCPKSVLQPGETMTCNATGVAVAGQYENIGEVGGTPPGGLARQFASDPSHYFGARPSIKIVKSTNGQDANAAPGPYVLVGSTVSWTYVVTNDGNVALTGIKVTDDKGVAVSCPADSLAASASMMCTASGTAIAGQYTNMGKVVGTPPGGLPPVTREDPSNYFGAQPSIKIVKSTNGQDANDAPGPALLVGSAVTWTYLVTNNGNVPLTNITVTDDKGVAVACLSTSLAAGASMTCTANGIATAGQYRNMGTVIGTPPVGPTVSAQDPSHYIGVAPAIAIKKTVNGDDANTPPGPSILVNSTVTWAYIVTNTGDVTLSNVKVTDNKIGAITCSKSTLAIGESITCTASGKAIAGAYKNTGTVTGEYSGTTVTANDPAHYFGANPAIAIKKTVNGEDANAAPGTNVLFGSAVNWAYIVTNTGNVALANVKVTDDKLVAVTCPQTTLGVGESITCTASGTAIAGQYTNLGTATGDYSGTTVTASDPANYFGARPSITIKKSVNGADADTPPGPTVLAGSTVNWTYVVANNGNVALSNVKLNDDKIGAVSCPKTTLAAGEPMICTASGTAIVGPYKNTGTVTGEYAGTTVTANDPANYVGVKPEITITKAVNGDDANTPPGLTVFAGNTVVWTYLVKNTGSVSLSNVQVKDDKLGAITCPKSELAVGDSMTCSASGTAIAGQYTNVGTATGAYNGYTVKDDDPANYFGANPALDLTKYVSVDNQASWLDANAAPGPSAFVGAPVYFKFVVKNTGNVTLSTLKLTDNVYSTSTCTIPATLAAGASFECIIGSSAAAGQHTNTGTASGVYGVKTVTDTDPANYFGAAPSVDIEKFVSVDNKASWDDADSATGPIAFVGAPVHFKFVVKNTGNVALANVTLTDSAYTACSVPSALEPGASAECSIGPISATAGQHTNTGTVTGMYNGATYRDTDPANYFGANPAIDLTKYVSVDNKASWADANAITGPSAFVGDPVYFKFVVKNTGNVSLANLTLRDSAYGTSACAIPVALAPDASFECIIGSYAATAGQHTNIATATGAYGSKIVSDTDPANYFGAAPAVDIEKFVSVDAKATWVDADAPSGPNARVTTDVFFKFVIKNTGNVALSNVTLSDNVYSTGACAAVPSPLAAGASYECVIGPLAATVGQHTDTGTVTGAYGGRTYSDKDDANYWGYFPYGKIAPTQTTCEMFVAGTASDLNELLYGVKGNTILNVAPGVLFYYTKFTAQSTNPTVLIEQSKTGMASFPFLGVQQNNQVSLYNADCSNSGLGTVVVTSGKVTVTMQGATVGREYVIGIKYDPSTVVGQRVPSPTTVHYDFATKIGGNIVDMDMNGLDLKKK
ncbi:MAG: hypothetical protein HY782_22665 [Chloroflexi bacterium]|nr:hypothetical protein [Chloroflexota bacterium]